MPMLPLSLRHIPAAATYDLRSRVLRPGQPRERAEYAADLQPHAFHLGAFTPSETLVGVASFYHEPMPTSADSPPGQERADWRLRGMAVEPALQGQGVGRALIVAALETLRANGGVGLWCNARSTAVPFYSALGFATVGEPFDMPDIGPHSLMMRRL